MKIKIPSQHIAYAQVCWNYYLILPTKLSAEKAMRLLTITLLMFPSLLLAVTRDELRWYYPADLWAFQPQLNYENYNAYPLNDDGIKFYDNQKLQGKPSFILIPSFIKFDELQSCTLDFKRYRKSAKKWLSCEPFHCEVMTSATDKDLEFVDPYSMEWIKTDSNRTKRDVCRKQVDIKIEKNYPLYEQLNNYLILPSGQEQYVTIDGKKFYGDFSFCKQKLSQQCRLNQKRESSTDSFVTRMKDANKTGRASSLIGQCFNGKQANAINCLQSYSFDSKDKDGVADSLPMSYAYIERPNLKEIVWDKKNIEELQGCLAKEHGLELGIYKGIKKKCLFVNLKLLMIDYPEAYVRIDSLAYERRFSANFPFPKVNIELKDDEY